jgi:wobble nucleotide-excising tRNase
LFEKLQGKLAITEGEVEFELNNSNRITGKDIPSANISHVRVFNRNFIAKTIEAIGEMDVAPIYFLGAESIAQQKQVEALKTELVAAREAMAKATTNKTNAEKVLDNFCIEKAKLIKEALLGSPEYANYDKRRFKEFIAKLKQLTLQPKTLSDDDKRRLRKQKELQAKPAIQKISISIPDIDGIGTRTSALLERSIVSQVIDELASDPEVGTWVQQGLLLHKGEHETDTCRFCGKEFSPERRAKLEAHFNDAFSSFQRDVDQTISDIEHQQKALSSMTFPDESRFYDHLTEEIQTAVGNAKQAINSVSQDLDQLKNTLERKKTTPFEPLRLNDDKPTQDLSDGELSGDDLEPTVESPGDQLFAAINTINIIIGKHQETTNNLNDEIKTACQALEQDYVLEAHLKFNKLATALSEAETGFSYTSRKPAELEKKITDIEREIVEHRRPAEELNRELKAYLGHGELKLDVKDTGYALMRDGKPASDLSEGERTAIAFLYFLKSLEDKAFDQSQGIVMIDDPVSSLDANSLFSAFGYMKERTRESHQLFILTHNFAFFRQVKNWFHHLKGQNKKDIAQRPGRFYSLIASFCNGERSAMISLIDPLLEEFESEYHFLFKQVYEVTNSTVPVTELAQYYGIPNVARRLIETFLAYRFPDCSGDLIKRFERVNFDAAKKTRILRLLNTYSHSGGISDPEHDPSILAETREVMKEILELIQKVDEDHYRGMVKLMASAEVEE